MGEEVDYRVWRQGSDPWNLFGLSRSRNCVWRKGGSFVYLSGSLQIGFESRGKQVGTAATPIHGQISKIQHAGNPIFEGIPSIFSAVQFNSLVADPNSLPEELEVIATSDKGEVMGLAAKGKPLWGVQFHPEVSPLQPPPFLQLY